MRKLIDQLCLGALQGAQKELKKFAWLVRKVSWYFHTIRGHFLRICLATVTAFGNKWALILERLPRSSGDVAQTCDLDTVQLANTRHSAALSGNYYHYYCIVIIIIIIIIVCFVCFGHSRAAI